MTSPHHTPDWLLERIALGELPPDELAAARARLAQEPDGPSRLAALEADSRAILARLPPQAVAREVMARAARPDSTVAAAHVVAAPRRVEASPPRPSWRFLPVLVPVLAAAALVVLVRPSTSSDVREAPATWGTPGILEPTRSKGLQPRLDVHRQSAARSERLTDGAPARAGDVVQLSYTAVGKAHGVLLSVDGRGAVTQHLPGHGEADSQSAVLERSGTHLLPRAYELDDAPGFERFFFITADAPFALDGVLSAARLLAASPDARTAPLRLPPELGQTSFLLEKPSP
ncbi:ActD-like protein [Corallococcus sicarius]|uniref:ActD-like protein n=1 Tax=Corallococcus sicarius TaxID=2316726 RepID=A0A3A8NDX7_9BACT|nr:ActD-like protein [Corallococcus sicarius]RKH40401.1 ActD-like protein [Corallococcus sicarius]